MSGFFDGRQRGSENRQLQSEIRFSPKQKSPPDGKGTAWRGCRDRLTASSASATGAVAFYASGATWSRVTGIAVGDTATIEVVRGRFDRHSVAHDDADVESSHFTRCITQNLVPAFYLDHILPVGQDIYDRSFKYNLFLFRHASSNRGDTDFERLRVTHCSFIVKNL